MDGVEGRCMERDSGYSGRGDMLEPTGGLRRPAEVTPSGVGLRVAHHLGGRIRILSSGGFHEKGFNPVTFTRGM